MSSLSVYEINPHHMDRVFINQGLAKIPKAARSILLNQYSKMFKSETRQKTNLWFLDVVEGFEKLNFKVANDDHALVNRARVYAECCLLRLRAGLSKFDEDQQLSELSAYADGKGILAPSPDDSSNFTVLGCIKRLCDDKWWRRKMRVANQRQIESVMIQLGKVKKQAGKYVSDTGLKSNQQSKKRNNALMEFMECVNQDTGESFAMSDVVAGSLSNPVIRRSELMVRIYGMQHLAKELGYAADFHTITLPSKYHAVLSKSGEFNPKYQRLNPRDGQRKLANLWARIRAVLHRKGVEIFGFRVAEPQHDGTPHWHMVLFMPLNVVLYVRSVIIRYFMAEDSEERGALKYRFKPLLIDLEKGSAAAYIAKYVSKNIDGFGIGKDVVDGEKSETAAERVLAWASVWGIRQFQQVGGAKVGVWRELRRLRDSSDGHDLEKIIDAVCDNDWKTYTLLVQSGEFSGLALFREIKDGKNKYGEKNSPAAVGLELVGVFFVTRPDEWKIEFSKRRETDYHVLRPSAEREKRAESPLVVYQ